MNLPHLQLKTCFLTAALVFSITLGPLARAGGTQDPQAFINDYGGEASGLLISRGYQADVNPVNTLSRRIDPWEFRQPP